MIRIISARLTTKKERQDYEKYTGFWNQTKFTRWPTSWI
jgi:hypothetical protein